MVTAAIDYKYLLLDNYKEMKLNEKEVLVILMMDHLINQSNPFITADLLALKMTLDIKEIDTILASLLKKGLIEYVSKGHKTVTSLNPLRDKLYKMLQKSLEKESASKKSEKLKDELDNIYSQFEKILGRSLSPVEFSRIREWVEYGYSDEMIINALKDALNQGKKSLTYVDRILLNYQMRDDIEKEGHTTINKDWNHNLEETIKIAKTPWLDDDK